MRSKLFAWRPAPSFLFARWLDYLMDSVVKKLKPKVTKDTKERPLFLLTVVHFVPFVVILILAAELIMEI